MCRFPGYQPSCGGYLQLMYTKLESMSKISAETKSLTIQSLTASICSDYILSVCKKKATRNPRDKEETLKHMFTSNYNSVCNGVRFLFKAKLLVI